MGLRAKSRLNAKSTSSIGIFPRTRASHLTVSLETFSVYRLVRVCYYLFERSPSGKGSKDVELQHTFTFTPPARCDRRVRIGKDDPLKDPVRKRKEERENEGTEALARNPIQVAFNVK